MRLVILTSDKTSWALRPFSWLFRKYWGEDQSVLVGGYSQPDSPLPTGFEFVSLGNFEDYPAQRWSDGAIKFMNLISDDLVLWMLDDYWLVRQADVEAVQILADYMMHHPEVARIDLTTDRLYAGNLQEHAPVARIDLVSNALPVPYLFSTQAGIWRRKALLHFLRPGETPWETEINGTHRMNDARACVLGTRQAPLRYLIAIQQGKLTLNGGYQIPRPLLLESDLREMKEAGIL